ncbi:MAG: hypothetical protein GEU88_07975, partial [Solirubrobacterales bacterium]|nr:hypothetical protein [Solirubrobacterales bacterium]
MSLAFTIAPADERTLAAGAYLLGVLELALIVGAFAYAAWRVRALALASWSGAPARLVESVLGLAGLVWLSEALGSVGAFGEATVLVGSLLVAGAAFAVCGRLERDRDPGAPAPPPP